MVESSVRWDSDFMYICSDGPVCFMYAGVCSECSPNM